MNRRNTVRRLDSARRNLAEEARLKSQAFKVRHKASTSMRKVMDELKGDEGFLQVAVDSAKAAFSYGGGLERFKIDVKNGTIFAVLNYGDWWGDVDSYHERQRMFLEEFKRRASEYSGVPEDYFGVYINASFAE